MRALHIPINFIILESSQVEILKRALYLHTKEPCIHTSFTHKRALHLHTKAPCIHIQKSHKSPVQGGEDSKNALSCRSFSAKEPLIIGLLRKMTCKDKASYGSSPPCTSHQKSPTNIKRALRIPIKFIKRAPRIPEKPYKEHYECQKSPTNIKRALRIPINAEASSVSLPPCTIHQKTVFVGLF